MTKMIRIENADTSTYKVQVIVQNKNAAGEWVDSPEVFPLHMPTQLTSVGIHSTRRVIVEEVPTP